MTAQPSQSGSHKPTWICRLFGHKFIDGDFQPAFITPFCQRCGMRAEKGKP